MASLTLSISGMHCGNCRQRVEKALRGVSGTIAASVDLAAGTAAVDFDAARATPERYVDAVTALGYQAQVAA
jgi:copper chaperone CopZ